MVAFNQVSIKSETDFVESFGPLTHVHATQMNRIDPAPQHGYWRWSKCFHTCSSFSSVFIKKLQQGQNQFKSRMLKRLRQNRITASWKQASHFKSGIFKTCFSLVLYDFSMVVKIWMLKMFFLQKQMDILERLQSLMGTLFKSNSWASNQPEITSLEISQIIARTSMQMVNAIMGAIWWETRGTCTPHFFRRGGHNMLSPPTFFS